MAAVVVLVVVVVVAAAAGILTPGGHHRTAARTASARVTADASPPSPEPAETARHLTPPSPTTRTARVRHRRAVAAPPAHTVGCAFHLGAARHIAETEHAAGYRVGFALVTATGHTLASVTPNTANYGASITKSMLLVAFLRDWAAGGLSASTRAELAAMIEVSDNTAADWVYEHLKSPSADVDRVAADAGMTGFHLDISDPVYVLGQSLVTAGDFARFFARIETFMPARARRYGMGLLAGVEERVGLLAAGLPGVVYSKEGWKPEDAGLLGAPYIVNQAGQFSCRGMTYGVAVTVGRAQDQQEGEAVVQRIVGALTH